MFQSFIDWKIFFFFLCINLIVCQREDENDKPGEVMLFPEMAIVERKELTEWLQWPKDKIMNIADNLTETKKCVEEDRMRR